MIEQQKTEVVLEYELQHADLVDAVRLILRKRKSGFVYRLPVVLAFALVGVAQIVLQAWTGRPDFLSVFLTLYVAVALYFLPHLSARRLLKANAHQGRLRLTVDEEGLRMVGAQADLRTTWRNYGSYAENDRVFVLRSPDRGGRCANVLVKRGAADPADIDRLRTLIGHHLPKV
ncbi:hypothetical protein [Streptomyces sp. HUAS TT20]|uniref:hypothetical protein n=1 Tax=Streptomyces sp. HUAS TT20 TaxID=3447509 RepID=UPI0021DA00C0|nr:hypothetical protein [Streptomyces sp. HUAS 15-9]UXY27444.1 hypothetical protein N8I87_13180 [Streptomyces sp. HUAS 15-9]